LSAGRDCRAAAFGVWHFDGTIVIGADQNGLVMLDANVYFEQAFLGTIILVAVIVDRVRNLWLAK